MCVAYSSAAQPFRMLLHADWPPQRAPYGHRGSSFLQLEHEVERGTPSHHRPWRAAPLCQPHEPSRVRLEQGRRRFICRRKPRVDETIHQCRAAVSLPRHLLPRFRHQHGRHRHGSQQPEEPAQVLPQPRGHVSCRRSVPRNLGSVPFLCVQEVSGGGGRGAESYSFHTRSANNVNGSVMCLSWLALSTSWRSFVFYHCYALGPLCKLWR